ncbi:nucleoside 2-deoxyribosyltransferase domain-containing protein [Amycolatopsis sp. 195334CR]|uniref:nucleoside 2-deoxyribosyltransferase domain-containing protein n=1 Tax=Amycolatopsis sp. 195334CR TaxID=2814588 RepID=UPI001A8CE0FB|nr:nucleoside 2-deoxyribosyltransferase domain-containing protein [Amycolatopsis sp. 195334CR]MBN6039871.1 nucleoside 2-deoxyribosyltransferase domain-containing protein [Amycolatopsis sp. 195334CR]
MSAGIQLVYAHEPVPTGVPSVMLLGPTPRSESVESWRPAAIDLLSDGWHEPEPLVVLSPESRGGWRAREYDDQVSAELEMIEAARALMFWIPRDLRTLPAFTTNVEFGLALGTTPDRVVLGCPPGCANPERNRYLIWHARRVGIPVCDTLERTAATALEIARQSPR